MRTAGRLWLIGLIAISAALSTTPAYAAGPPAPSASWHGRAIQRPETDAWAVVVTAADRRAGRPQLRIGAGYGHAGGSAAVRRVQRLLARIGYRCGPIDGLFGPRTRASVEWFQIKHGLRPTGRVGPLTIALLRLRAAGANLRPRAAPARAPVAAPPPRARSLAPVSTGHALPAFALGGAALLVVLATGILLRWRREAPAASGASAEPGGQAPAMPPPRVPRVIGYASGPTRAECVRRAQAIERACRERGWPVTAIVRERQPGHGGWTGRRGLAVALEQLSSGAGGRLVACRLNDVGASRRDLASLLGWCSRSGVHLVALDVGLDTGTSHGRLAARCLAVVGDAERNRSGRGLASPGGLRETAAGGATKRTAQEVQS